MAATAAVAVLLLAACGSGGEDAASREAARADHQAVKQATADLYPQLASATGDVSAEPEAVLLYAGCGMSGLFSGVKSSASFSLTQPSMGDDRLGQTLASTLREDGWSVPTVGPDAFSAVRGRLTLAVSYAAAATFRLTSECADSSADVARSFEDRPDETIPLS